MARDDESEESINLDDLSDHLGEDEEDESDDGVEEVEEDEEELEQMDPEAEKVLNYNENFEDQLHQKYVDGRDDESEATASEVPSDYHEPEQQEWTGYVKNRNRAALGLYPTIEDPKLFMVRVKSGFARTLCTQIMYKCLHRSSRGTDMMIKSVFCRDHLAEYIYIEAHRQAHVLNVISGLQGAWRKVKLIPVSEMPSTLAATRTTSDVKPLSWGRFRYGVHKGDLCRIIEIDDVKQAYTIDVIPRVDFEKLFETADTNNSNEAGFRVNKLKKRTRPMQRFFTDVYFGRTQLGIKYDGSLEKYRKEMKEKGEDPDTLKIKVGGKTFTIKGHEQKVVRQAAITTEKNVVNLTTDEHLRFNLGQVPSKKLDFVRLKEIREVDLQVGDNVKVISGELKNTTGVVKEIYEDATGTKYNVLPTNNVFLKDCIPFTKDTLEKTISEGTHVKVMTGGRAGESGMVVAVENGMVRVFSSRVHEELTVFMSDVIETDEVARGVPMFGQFEVFELVKLRGSGFGMITKIENGHFTILTNLGRSIDAGHSEIQEVLCSTLQSTTRKGRRQSALDRFGNEIMQGDVVKVISDKSLWEGKEAVIKHVYMDSVWLEARDVRQDMGFFVMTRQDVWQVGGDKKPQEITYVVPDAEKAEAAKKKAEAEQAPEKKGGKRPRDTATMVGKRVRIVSGYYKGYLGRITGIHGVQARVELHTGELNVTVALTHVKEIDTEDSLATSEQVASRPKIPKKKHEHDVMPVLGATAHINMDDTVSEAATMPDWASEMSAFSDLQSRASSAASSRVLGDRGSSVASGASGRRRPTRRLGGVKSEVVSSIQSATAIPVDVQEGSLAPVEGGDWWMVPKAVGILNDGSASNGENAIILRASNTITGHVVVRLPSGSEKEVDAGKVKYKVSIDVGQRVAVLNRPGTMPLEAFTGIYHGPGVDLDTVYVRNEASNNFDTCNAENVVELA